MEQKNNVSVIKPVHYGKWVALSRDKSTVIAYDNTLSELQKKVGNKKVVFQKPIDPKQIFAFF